MRIFLTITLVTVAISTQAMDLTNTTVKRSKLTNGIIYLTARLSPTQKIIIGLTPKGDYFGSYKNGIRGKRSWQYILDNTVLHSYYSQLSNRLKAQEKSLESQE